MFSQDKSIKRKKQFRQNIRLKLKPYCVKKTGNENDIKIYIYRYIKFFSRFTVNIKNVYKICI